MRKILVTVCLLFMLLAFVLAMGGMAFAKVSGSCVNCHTMHNSQGNAPGVFGTGVIGPLGALVKSTCEGCHTTAGSDPLATPSGGSGLYPYVKGNFSDMNCLAGGYFPLTTEKTATGFDPQNSGGNAHSLGSTYNPPGYDDTWYGAESGFEKLSCAGDLGCHGDQNKRSWDGAVNKEMDAIKGGHHGTAEFIGYRMLITNIDGLQTPVAGTGASDYEKSLIANTTAPTGLYTRTDATYSHNIYSAGVDDNGTISKLCANCHGDYHGVVGTGLSSPWHRHPTDLALPASWDPADDNISSNVDCKYNPFGFAVDAINTAGAKYATCLSCHRAHGTDNMDLLRFAYNTYLGDPATGQSAGGGNMYGCLGCHSNQR